MRAPAAHLGLGAGDDLLGYVQQVVGLEPLVPGKAGHGGQHVVLQLLYGCLVMEVLPIACDECPVTEISVGPACRGCIAHRCMEVCPKGAIHTGGPGP